MDLSNPLLSTAFAAIVAFDLKPYGPEPTTVDLASLLGSPTLACDGYTRLAWYFADLIPQTHGTKIVALGWDGGAVGNHAEMMVSDTHETLFLDSTVGLVVRGLNYDTLLRGEPAPHLASFWGFNSDRVNIATFPTTVDTAFRTGGYRPKDALYYFDTLGFFNAPPAASVWPTPAAVRFH